jgi:acyl carrier protein
MIRLSGAPITRQDFDLYKQNFSPATLLRIGMGSTEAGRICSAVLDQTFCFPNEGTAAGYPCPDKKILLLNDNGQEVGPNEVGEIAVKGRGLALGYWQKPELTSTKFASDPSGKGDLVYLTGDLGRMLPDGFLIHLGRKDLMVKIRGYRVELGEIERVLLSHPKVKEVAVATWDRDSGEKCLVAYVVSRDDAKTTTSELYDFLRGKLPDYMMPSTFVFLRSLPLNNGKLDRAALPLPDHIRPQLPEPYVPPKSENEQKLVQIWEEVLDVRPIGTDDNFFDLGGHSLSATRVVSQVIKHFQLELPIEALFQSPTVAEMAVVINEHPGKKLGERELDRILTELESMSDEEAQGSAQLGDYRTTDYRTTDYETTGQRRPEVSMKQQLIPEKLK